MLQQEEVAVQEDEELEDEFLPPPPPPPPYLEDDDACKLVLHHRAISRTELASPTSVALLVGPEGGLSAAEITLAEDAGFESLALGPRVLRTETAPLAALAILQSRWGDMAF